MFSRIHSTTIAVADQDAALDFYVNTLGWQVGLDSPMGPEMRFLSVVPPGAATQLVLGKHDWFTDDDSTPSKAGISLVTPDIDATYDTLTSRGVKFKDAPAMMPWGQKAAWFFDPDGNEFFLVEEA